MFHIPDHPPAMDAAGLRLKLAEVAPQLSLEQADQLLAGMADAAEEAVLLVGPGQASVIGLARYTTMLMMRETVWHGAALPVPPARADDQGDHRAVLLDARGECCRLDPLVAMELDMYSGMLSQASTELRAVADAMGIDAFRPTGPDGVEEGS